VFTARTGFGQPNGIGTNYLVTRTTRYAANCYLQPSVVLQGRIVRVGVDLKW
jgi:hypothetical protein